MKLGKIHFYSGIVIIIIFVLTGQYMHHNFDHLKDMELMNRALFRAGHLHILLFGLINISIGSYFKPIEDTLYKYIQIVGSVIIFISCGLVIYSFFAELPTQQIERPLTRISLYLIFFGVAIHDFIPLVKNKKGNSE